MKIAAAILAVLALAPAASPQQESGAAPLGGTARWQRVLTPPSSHPTAEQCVVVDADLYAHAAPGLRDVRLVQDGQELPYAMDVSFDTRVAEAAPPPLDDRAQYEPVQVIPLRPQPDTPGIWSNEALLSAHVPIERIRLDPAPKSVATVELHAAARMDLAQSEEIHATLTPSTPFAPFTIGANLQEEADILVRVRQPDDAPKSIVLEMRRRELCYHPRSASPIHLFVGDVNALPAHYDYALHFQPSATPIMAAMGPLTPNPAFRSPPAVRSPLPGSASLRLSVTLVILLGSLAVIAFAIYELRRR